MKTLFAKNTPAAQTDRFLIGCGLFVFALTAMWAVFFVPMNMDEAGIYRILGCIDYPFAPSHIFRAACGTDNDLVTPFGLHIARSEFYNGILHPVLYAPFYFLLHTPGAQYLFGLVCLIAFAGLIARETAKPLLSFSIIVSFFPFVFQFIHDTGPVTLGMLLFPLGACFFKRTVRAPVPLCYGFAVIVALLLIGAAEDKAFFFYVLPSLALFALALSAEERNFNDLAAALKKTRAPIIVLGLVAATGFVLLLLSTNARGQYYGSWLADLSGARKQSVEGWLGDLFNFIFYWPSYGHYLFDLSEDSTAALPFKIAAIGFGTFCVLTALPVATRFRSPLRPMLLGLSFAASVIIFFVMRNTWAGHHFIFLWTPLIVLLADMAAGLTPGLALGLVVSLFALDLASLLTLTQQPVQTRNAAERAAIFHFFADDARAGRAIINYSSWGGSFIQSLYGPESQIVTFTEPFDEQLQSNMPVMPDMAQQLLLLSRQTGRTLYDVCYGPLCNAAALEAAFGNELSFADALPGLADWHVFIGSPRVRR